jgi:hypothetical protein
MPSKYDESRFLHLVRPGQVVGFDDLRHAAVGFVLAAHDRQVTDDAMYSAVASLVNLTHYMAWLEFSTTLRNAYRKTDTPSPALEDGTNHMIELVTANRASIAQQLQLLMECRNRDIDAVN